MKKPLTVTRGVLDRPSGHGKAGAKSAISSQVGGVTIFRSTRTDENGERVIVELAPSTKNKLARETAKQIRAIVAAPISSEQRSRAAHLAKNAKDAQASAITAKFRRSAA